MHAATHHTYGSPDVLQIREVPMPAIGPNDVLVEVHASAVTQGDRRMRAADFPGISWLLGRLVAGVFRPRNPIPGTVYSGRVAAVGAQVTRFVEGDDVFGATLHSAQAAYVAVPEDSEICARPSGLTHQEAAAIPYGSMTSLLFLRDMAELEPGQRVAIVGAAGGVGLYAVQIAKHMGAEVTGVCAADSFDIVREMGADHVVDYRAEDFTLAGPHYDVIFDTPGVLGFQAARKALRPTGRYLTLSLGLQILAEMALTAMWGGRRAMFGVSFGAHQDLDELRRLAEQQVLLPVVDRCYPLAQIANAHGYVEDRQGHGTVVVDLQASHALSAAAK